MKWCVAQSDGFILKLHFQRQTNLFQLNEIEELGMEMPEWCYELNGKKKSKIENEM